MIALRKKIVYRQAKMVLIISLTIGLFFSLIQIMMDYKQQKIYFAETLQRLIDTTSGSAEFAIYNFDNYSAQKVAVGLINYPIVHEVRILDEVGEIFVDESSTVVRTSFSPFLDYLFADFSSYSVPLYHLSRKNEKIGLMEIKIDTYALSKDFFTRAGGTLLFGLLRNFILALLLIGFFNQFLGRPMVNISEALKGFDSKHNRLVRLPIPDNHQEDEFGLMIKRTNYLLKAIKEGHEAEKQALDLKSQIVTQQIKEQSMLLFQEKLQKSNEDLSESLQQVSMLQTQLIESEKMSAMVVLTSGVAHEVNTPLGTSITANSVVKEELDHLKILMNEGQLSEAKFKASLGQLFYANTMITASLERAANTLSNFKKIAVDQYDFDSVEVNIYDHVESIIQTFEFELKNKPIEIKFTCPKSILLTTFAGAWFQIISNLVYNSIKHGFSEQKHGIINLAITEQDKALVLEYTDSGCGVTESVRSKIFDPFFTTKRGEGGTGLGMNIVYNLVKNKLGGTIECKSTPGEGLTVLMTLPKCLP